MPVGGTNEHPHHGGPRRPTSQAAFQWASHIRLAHESRPPRRL